MRDNNCCKPVCDPCNKQSQILYCGRDIDCVDIKRGEDLNCVVREIALQLCDAKNRIDGLYQKQFVVLENIDCPENGFILQIVDLITEDIIEEYSFCAGISDAPSDGNLYGRQDGEWVEVEEGIQDAPLNGSIYVRRNGNWEVLRKYIPLAGTDMGEPVTGDIEVDPDIVIGTSIDQGLLFNSIVKTSLISDDLDNTNTGKISYVSVSKDSNNPIYIGLETKSNGSTTGFKNILINSGSSSGIIITDTISNVGLKGANDFTSNIGNLDYAQKIYVDGDVLTLSSSAITIPNFTKSKAIINIQNFSGSNISVPTPSTHRLKTMIIKNKGGGSNPVLTATGNTLWIEGNYETSYSLVDNTYEFISDGSEWTLISKT